MARLQKKPEEKVKFKRRMQDAFRKKLLQDAENEEGRKTIVKNLTVIKEPEKESKLMNRFKLNAARKNEKAKTVYEKEVNAHSPRTVKNGKAEPPMNRASVDLTPIMPKL